MSRANLGRLAAIAFCVIIWAAILTLAGCARASDPPTGTDAPGDTSPPKDDPPFSDRHGVGVYVDPETGCHYLRSYGKGITPRMSNYENGKQRQLGCFEVIRMKNPMEGLNK